MQPTTARCPSCGSPFSKAAVLALAPVCDSCGAVAVSFGGSLGITGAYGVNDGELTRKRVEGDLAVLLRHEQSLVGATEAARDQLTWTAARYATLPLEPRLELVPRRRRERLSTIFSSVVILGPILGVVLSFCWVPIRWYCRDRGIYWVPRKLDEAWEALGGDAGGGWKTLLSVMAICVAFMAVVILVGASLTLWLLGLGVRAENRRRQRTYRSARQKYETAKAEALKAGEIKKAAEDYRVRLQLRDSEALLITVREKIVSVQSSLASC